MMQAAFEKMADGMLPVLRALVAAAVLRIVFKIVAQGNKAADCDFLQLRQTAGRKEGGEELREPACTS